jgi:predicted Zn-dependent protease with MMP-like domain
MIEISDDDFADLIEESLTKLPKDHAKAVKNVAIVYEDEPSAEQREMLNLQCHETLFGLYEGVPLSQRQGMTHFGPDKITIFKGPITRYAETREELERQITHTVWHEVAHYFGLNHKQIHELERKFGL